VAWQLAWLRANLADSPLAGALAASHGLAGLRTPRIRHAVGRSWPSATAPYGDDRRGTVGVMIEVLIAIAVVVGVVAAADLLLTFAVIRRLAALESRTRRLPGTAQSGSPAIGHRVGDFRVRLISGDSFSQADLAEGSAIVMFVMPSCEPCQEAIAELRGLPAPLPFPLYVLVADPDPDADISEVVSQLPAQAQIGKIATIDATTTAFGLDGFPTALVIEDGIVRANELKVGSLLELARQ
jgi:hypothetical protein